MNIATCVRKTASAALLTFLMGSAAACAADVSARQIVLAYAGNDFLVPYLRYPGASAEYSEEPGFVGEQLIEVVGALSVGLQRVGTADDKIASSALLGRAFLLNGDRRRAGQQLDAALAGATSAGWDDGRANGILRDLAWLAGANGEEAAATDYLRRAETCPLPCADDALPLFHDEAKAAMAAVFAALGPDLGATRIDMAEGEDSIAFAEATFGPQSEELMGAWHSRAVAAADARPWQALDYYQQLLAIHVAAGKNDAQTLDIRRAVAGLLLKAGEYRRLADFAAALIPDALAAARGQTDILYLPGIATQAARLRARALWHLSDPGTQDAYVVAVDTMFEFGDADMARLLLQDLLDARDVEGVTRVADGLLLAYAGDGDALFAKARVAAWSKNFGAAAALVAQISEQGPVALLQRAFYLEKAGQTVEAAALRAGVKFTRPEGQSGWGPWSEVSQLLDPRDAGAYEGAAEVAKAYLGMADRMISTGSYADAQRLWQIAYTLAIGGETAESFRLMKEAAEIAARLSFADANDTDGGSLQLLRRDKFRYLLFVDIAWAAATGGPPDSMSVSSRY